MLDLLEKLRKRLDELDDGTFVIEDRETERVKNL
jgi:ATP-dependent RNA helicase